MELLKHINYKAKKFGLHPSEYAIAQNKKYGVQKEIDSLKNWMTNNRHKFTDKDRTSKVEPGNKERYEHLTWHGLRYYYAQNRVERRISCFVQWHIHSDEVRISLPCS